MSKYCISFYKEERGQRPSREYLGGSNIVSDSDLPPRDLTRRDSGHFHQPLNLLTDLLFPEVCMLGRSSTPSVLGVVKYPPESHLEVMTGVRREKRDVSP